MKSTKPLTRYLLTSDIADILQISTTWARYLMKTGKIKATFSGRYRTTQADLLAYLQADNSIKNKTIIYLNNKLSDTERGHTALEDEATNIININTDCATPFIEVLKSSTGADAFELVEVNN